MNDDVLAIIQRSLDAIDLRVLPRSFLVCRSSSSTATRTRTTS